MNTTGLKATMSGIGKQLADLNGTRMAYVEFWRQRLAESGPGSHTFAEHRECLDAWFETVGVTRDVTLVGHDWGSALGFHRARRHPDAVRGIAYMAAAIRPGRWAEFPPPAVELFQALRSPAGEQMILEQNMFVEAILPGGVPSPLAPEVLAEYRRPFAAPGEGRRPTLSWAPQIPLDGEPADVTAIMEDYGAWPQTSPIPKLLSMPTWADSGRRRARVLSHLAAPDRGHRPRPALHPRRLRQADRARHTRLASARRGGPGQRLQRLGRG